MNARTFSSRSLGVQMVAQDFISDLGQPCHGAVSRLRIGAASDAPLPGDLVRLALDVHGAVQEVDVTTLQAQQLTRSERAESCNEKQARSRGAMASARSNTVEVSSIGRSPACSMPAPLIPQGSRAISSSLTAVMRMARSRRYDFAAWSLPLLGRDLAVPLANTLGCNLAQLGSSEMRAYVAPEQRLVTLPGHRCERSTLDETSF